ncbi:hypothetical protein AAG906_040309 [Vitis piasezkii]
MLPPRVFGCVAYVHLHKTQRTKLDSCVLRCLFLGYVVHQKGYQCHDSSTRRTYVTMDGKTQNEKQNWLHFDWPNSETVVNETLSPDPIVEPKVIHFPLLFHSTRDPPLENIPEVSTLDMSSNISDLNTLVRYTLPFKENHQSIQLPTMCLPGDYLNPLEHLYIYFPQVKFQLEFRKPCLTQNGLRQ